MSEAIPWAQWVRIAAWLGVAPHNFWRLSLREWRALTGAGVNSDGLSRVQFDALAQAFPDEELKSHD